MINYRKIYDSIFCQIILPISLCLGGHLSKCLKWSSQKGWLGLSFNRKKFWKAVKYKDLECLCGGESFLIKKKYQSLSGKKKRSKNSSSESKIFCWWIQLGCSDNSNPWYIFAGTGLADGQCHIPAVYCNYIPALQIGRV